MITISDDDLIQLPIITRGSWMETVNEIHGIYPLRILTEPQPTFSGSFAIAGAIFITSSRYNFSVIVFNKDGITWAKSYHAGAEFKFAYAESIIEVSDGLVIAGQMSIGFYQNLALLKVDKDTGAVIWSTVMTNTDSSDEFFYSVTETSDNGLVCVGRVRRNSNEDICIIKYTSSGSVSWTKTIIGTTYNDYGMKIIELSSGDLILCGFNEADAENNKSDAIIIKLTSAGVITWTKRYNKTGTNDLEAFFDIQETSDGGFIAIGQADEASTNNRDILIVKTTSDGSVSWGTRIVADSSFNDRFGYKIREVSDGYVLVGYHPDEVSLTKITSLGVWSWSKKLLNSSSGLMFYGDLGGLAVTDIGICFTGITFNSGTSAYDVIIGYTNLDGEIDGCSFLSDDTVTTESGLITANSLSLSTSTLTIGTESHSITVENKDLVLNNYCSSGDYFAHEISTDETDKNIEPYEMIALE